MTAQFRLLGPLSVQVDGEPVALGGPKRRALLATLLLEAGEVVTRDRLIDALWGEEPPDTARNTLQVYVSQLRKLLPEGLLETSPSGYRLAIERSAVDVFEFERLAQEGQSALTFGDASGAAETLTYTNSSGTDLTGFLVIDAWPSPTPGDFTLSLAITP